MRFKRSDLVKECLLADMEGDPLPIGPATPITKNPWKKQKVCATHTHRETVYLSVFLSLAGPWFQSVSFWSVCSQSTPLPSPTTRSSTKQDQERQQRFVSTSLPPSNLSVCVLV